MVEQRPFKARVQGSSPCWFITPKIEYVGREIEITNRFNIEPAKTWELQNEANSFKDKVGEAIVELLNGGFFKLKTKPSAPQNSVENSSIR